MQEIRAVVIFRSCTKPKWSRGYFRDIEQDRLDEETGLWERLA